MGKFLRYPMFTNSAWPEDFLNHLTSRLLHHRKPEASKIVEYTAFLVSPASLYTCAMTCKVLMANPSVKHTRQHN